MKTKLLFALICLIYGCSDTLYPELEIENEEVAKSAIVERAAPENLTLFYSVFREQLNSLTEKQKSHLNTALLKIIGDPVGARLIQQLQYFSAKGIYIDIEIDHDLGPDAMYNRNMRKITLKTSRSISLDVLLFEELFHVFQDNDTVKNLNSEIEAQFATFEYSLRHGKYIYNQQRNDAFYMIHTQKSPNYSYESIEPYYSSASFAVKNSSLYYENFEDKENRRDFKKLRVLTYGLNLPIIR